MTLKSKVQAFIINFLGLNSFCRLSNRELRDSLAKMILETPKVFGDRNRVRIGDGVVLNDVLINTSSGEVIIENFVFFGHGASLITGTHDYNKFGSSRQTAIPASGRDIVVEEGAWVASNVTILGPCRVGKNAVIAAGSVVIDDVDPETIYAGNPAKMIKKIQSIKNV